MKCVDPIKILGRFIKNIKESLLSRKKTRSTFVIKFKNKLSIWNDIHLCEHTNQIDDNC